MLLYRSYPSWVENFNYLHWMERSKHYSLYAVDESQSAGAACSLPHPTRRTCRPSLGARRTSRQPTAEYSDELGRGTCATTAGESIDNFVRRWRYVSFELITAAVPATGLAERPFARLIDNMPRNSEVKPSS